MSLFSGAGGLWLPPETTDPCFQPPYVLFLPVFKMNVGVAHSEVNPNTRVMNSRGIWLTYLLLTVVLHIILLSIPFFSVPLVWTLTNVIHNLVSHKALLQYLWVY